MHVGLLKINEWEGHVVFSFQNHCSFHFPLSFTNRNKPGTTARYGRLVTNKMSGDGKLRSELAIGLGSVEKRQSIRRGWYPRRGTLGQEEIKNKATISGASELEHDLSRLFSSLSESSGNILREYTTTYHSPKTLPENRMLTGGTNSSASSLRSVAEKSVSPLLPFVVKRPLCVCSAALSQNKLVSIFREKKNAKMQWKGWKKYYFVLFFCFSELMKRFSERHHNFLIGFKQTTSNAYDSLMN